MKPLTVEFMRGRFEALVGTTQAAKDLFESYLSGPAGSPDKQQDYDRLLKVLATIKERHGDLLKSLKKAVKEDG